MRTRQTRQRVGGHARRAGIGGFSGQVFRHRGDIAQRVNLGHHIGGLINRRQLHALHLLQDRPATVAKCADQGHQHGKGPKRAGFDTAEPAFLRLPKDHRSRRERIAPRFGARALGRHRARRGRRGHAMCHFKIRFAAEPFKGVIGIHAQIACVRAHKPGDEARGIKSGNVSVFNRCDVAGFDLEFALHVQKRFAQGRALSAHQVAQAHVEIVKAHRPRGLWC